MSQPGNTDAIARARGVCRNCEAPAVLYAQETAAALKGVWWCVVCSHVAFGGASWFKLTEEQKLTAPRLAPNRSPCEVCYRSAVLECHHLAPRAQFGDEADRWPTVMICHDCHRRWEDRMETHRRRTA